MSKIAIRVNKKGKSIYTFKSPKGLYYDVHYKKQKKKNRSVMSIF